MNNIQPIRQVTQPPLGTVVISSLMSAYEIITHLGHHGCENITNRLDISSCSAYPVSNGGFGDVYRGSLSDGTPVAIKAVRFQINSSAAAEKPLKHAARELHTWSKCRHPNVIGLLGLVEFRGQIGMVSPWMDNGSLLLYLDKYRDANRCRMCVQISEGLAYLHRSNIIHGDLKGANVLISDNGTPMLTDFGNAVLHDRTLQFTHTMAKPSFSPRWAAPEMIQGSSTYSFAADVYALGMTILETITGQVPYPEKNDLAVFFAVAMQKEHPKRPEDHIPSDSQHGNALWSILTRCWAYEAKARPSTVDVLNVMRTTSCEGLRHIPSEIPSSPTPGSKNRGVAGNGKIAMEPENETPPVIMLRGHTDEVFVVAWNPKIPNLLATGGKDATILLWNVTEDSEPEQPTRICRHFPSARPDCDITTIAWNTDGSLLATGAWDGIVRVWTCRGELFSVMTQPQVPITSIKWDKSRRLLSGSLDGTTIVYDVESSRKRKRQFHHHNASCFDAEWLDGDFFASCGSDRLIFVECLNEDTPVARLQGHADEVNILKYEPEHKLLASGSDDYTACIWKVGDFNQKVFDPPADWVVERSPEVRVYTHKLRGHDGEVTNVAWQPYGNREMYGPVLVTSSFDGTVRMWNGHTGDCMSVLDVGSEKMCGHSLTPKGDALAIVAGNKLILVKDGKEIFKWQDKDSLFETAWTVNGKMVAVAMKNHMVAVVRIAKINMLKEDTGDNSSQKATAAARVEGDDGRLNGDYSKATRLRKWHSTA